MTLQNTSNPVKLIAYSILEASSHFLGGKGSHKSASIFTKRMQDIYILISIGKFNTVS